MWVSGDFHLFQRMVGVEMTTNIEANVFTAENQKVIRKLRSENLIAKWNEKSILNKNKTRVNDWVLSGVRR